MDENDIPVVLSYLRETMSMDEGELPWPAGLTEDEQVAFMNLLGPDAGLGVISLNPAVARAAIRAGSLDAL